ncbi:MAG TPA: PLP-dependent aminotransferase family protein [Gemmatimonadaceae bacterium]|nr:PLP-dependent aminotransferase family protein [Gemmatimonadaceae bacterium]
MTLTPRIASAVGPVVALDADSVVPLYEQLYQGLRTAIVEGRLRRGSRMPGTRMLADDLGISRNTATLAYDQLSAEGYLERRQRGGTFVARVLPDRLLLSRRAPAPLVVTRHQTSARTLSARGAALAGIALPSSVNTRIAPRAFRPGVPALDAFPVALWARLSARYWRRLDRPALAYGHSAGHQPLREAIAQHLAVARGVRCTSDQVIIVGGSQQALDLTMRLLLDPHDTVWLEDPGYLGARAAFTAAEARIVPVPVDDEGLIVSAGERLAPDARMVFVSPAHQHPTGAVMSAARRHALLRWAHRADAWIIEDDYDSEIRYRGRPQPALQGVDGDGRVIYVGTFSKTLFPALRLGYVVVPTRLVDAFRMARLVADRHSSIVEQAVLAEFITGGHYARHVRRMRALYAERQDALLDAARTHLGGLVDVRPTDAGMDVVAWLPPGVDDRAVERAALDVGVEARPLSPFSQAPLERGALLLNFAGYEPGALRAAMKLLAVVVATAVQAAELLSAVG